MIAAFHLMGPGLGVPSLQQMFPGTARRELEDLAHRYRYVYRERHKSWQCVLRWRQAGAVWAMDFTQPPLPVDDQFGDILVVRDLASGRLLAALPTEAATGAMVCAALRALFMAHGAPLVLKSDNGSHFVNADVEALLDLWGTIALLSPPGTPAYNGACEAGIGGLKTRAHHESARHDRAGQWTCDDVETARLVANETARPWGLASATPDRAWRARTRIGLDDRQRFAELVTRLRKEVELEQEDGPPLAHDARAWASIERIAVSRALIERGSLQLRRRRIALPIRQRRAKKIT